MSAVRMLDFRHLRTSKMGPYPALKKQGFISENGGESTPFVWRGRLLRLEMRWGEEQTGGELFERSGNRGAILDCGTLEVLSDGVAPGRRFLTAFCEDDVVHVYATERNAVYEYRSADLSSWTERTALVFPENFLLYNTAVCASDGGYVMAAEAAAAPGTENPYIGVPFTIFFAQSPDLDRWTLRPFDDAFGRDRYAACPTLRYADGWLYMISLEALPFYRFAPYIFRTRDFRTWEVGCHNPILIPSEEDRRPKAGMVFSRSHVDEVRSGYCSNLSDVELCEFRGQVHMVYCTGNQTSWEGVICEAVFDGPMSDLLPMFFDCRP